MADKDQPPSGADKPARRKKTPEERLAELDEQRKRIEQRSAAVAASEHYKNAIAKLRELDFDGAIEAGNAAAKLCAPHIEPLIIHEEDE